MEEIQLISKKRTKESKGSNKQLRNEGRIPAIYYGVGQENILLDVDAKEFASIIRRHLQNRIISLKFEDGAPEQKAVIKDMQRDVIKGDVTHVDFLHVSMDKKVHMDVPVEYVGEPVGVKTKGGILQILTRSIQVECLPGDIPEKITVDISGVDIGHSLHVSDVTIPNATILDTSEEVLATVTGAKAEKEEDAEAAEGEEGATEKAEPEIVDAKGKKEEESGDSKEAPKKE